MKYAWMGVLVLSFLLLGGCKGSDLVSVHGGTAKITKTQFDQLRTGMTQSEVEGILGGDCVVQSETGAQGSDFHTVMYACDGNGQMGANMNYMIQGGKLVNKAQFGLQ
jgi:major membrane immunogen (membrane-anchored lipoprotein)